MRTAIYARFSTELQQERSIEDQFALCRAYAAKNGLDVVGTYDRARSGASIFGRDGLMRMMDAARDGAFAVILVEALDRLSRDQEDLAGLWKRLNFLGIELRAVHDGKADQIQIAYADLSAPFISRTSPIKSGVACQALSATGGMLAGALMDTGQCRANPVNSRSTRTKPRSFAKSLSRMSAARRHGKSQCA
jgi:Resolvase, N terminal domain